MDEIVLEPAILYFFRIEIVKIILGQKRAISYCLY